MPAAWSLHNPKRPLPEHPAFAFGGKLLTNIKLTILTVLSGHSAGLTKYIHSLMSPRFVSRTFTLLFSVFMKLKNYSPKQFLVLSASDEMPGFSLQAPMGAAGPHVRTCSPS